MTDRIMALVAAATLAAFLGILVWKVPRVDLATVIAITLALAIWDFMTSAGRNSGRR
ncbi:MAG: hypothetical protein WDZ83_15435 [Rhizobiaceae bacterium]